jgi:hypothetical protein
MAYSAITAGEVDTDSPITTSLMTKIKDNDISFNDGTGIADDKILNRHLATGSVNQDSIANDSVGQGEILAGAVHQSEVSVSSEVDSITSGSGTFLTSAGQYALSVEAYGTAGIGGTIEAFEGLRVQNSSAHNAVGHRVMLNIPDNGSVNCRTSYITASPPYDLGDGEIPIFVWIMLDGGIIKAVSVSETPTWAYNGPTNIRPDRVSTSGGITKKYKNVISVDEDSGEITVEEVEITMAMKNADIDIHPHPFYENDLQDKVILLLDPVETEYLLNLHRSGESINELLHKDYLRLDNTPINRATPTGVIPSKFKWKNTQSRAGAMIKDRRLKQGPFAEGAIIAP